MIPFFIYYSMFGFQRIGDLIWAAADCGPRASCSAARPAAPRSTAKACSIRTATACSTRSPFRPSAPTIPAYAYETAVIVFDGLKRMYEDDETAIYYITLENENYVMPEMPDGCEEGIIRGMYTVSTVDARPARQSTGCNCSAAGRSCAKRCGPRRSWPSNIGVASDVWSVTSYTQLRRDAQECERWNMLNPERDARESYVAAAARRRIEGLFVAAQRLRAGPGRADRPWMPGGLFALGTDGMGRSETREALRRHFEVDAECIAVASLYRLSQRGQVDKQASSPRRSRSWASTRRSPRRCMRESGSTRESQTKGAPGKPVH